MIASGWVDPEFDALRHEFESLWDDSYELGAAIAVYRDGRVVADLWAGTADDRTSRPWEESTRALTFSVSKGVLAICVLRLVQSGAIELDSPVADYWPEFGAHGKDRITVGWVMSHRAGLAYLDSDLSRAEALSWGPVIRAIERQSPNWEPNAAYAYHAQTYGFILGELIWRVSGLSPQEYLASTITAPLGVTAWWGTPESELGSLARMAVSSSRADAPRALAEIDASVDNDSRVWRSITLNGAVRLPVGGSRRDLDYNDVDVLGAQLPAANLVISARDLARLYASTIHPVDGVRTLDDAIVDRALRPLSIGPELYGIGAPTEDSRRGLGFQLSSSPTRPWLGARSFGHDGASGSVGFADPDSRIAFAYVNNRMPIGSDRRAARLIATLAEVVAKNGGE